MYQIILASASPRRKEILEQVGISFQVHPSQNEEIITKNIPQDIVMELSEIKAMEVAEFYGEGNLIIGADTLVVLDGQVMGKPKNEQEAFSMIESIQGRWHQVYTGVTVIIKGKKEDKITFYEETKVCVKSMNQKEIQQYILSKEPYDKAGGYGIQGLFALYVSEIQGDYNNIVGFPIAKLYSVLEQKGIHLKEI